ncbi:MAG: bifunctional enoyl-CoA hydratase/phosphate acetyltransferase [Planctomycetota bacterium]
MPLMSFDEIHAAARARGKKRVVVAGADDDTALTALSAAYATGMVTPIAVGEPQQIQRIAAQINVSLEGFTIVAVSTPDEAARVAVRMVRDGAADIYMKGNIPTSAFMHAALDRHEGLRAGQLLSHATVIWSEKIKRTFIITDGGINIQPTLEEKAAILANALPLARLLGSPRPKVAVMAAVEKINSKMPATMDAAKLARMGDDGVFGDCNVGGPFALDNAVCEEAARKKGISHAVAGHAEIMLAPDIHSGNLMSKAIMYFAECHCGGIVMGASVPIVFLSRADTAATRLNSLALGVLTAN